MTSENALSLGGGHTQCPLRQGPVWPMGLVGREVVRRHRPVAPGGGGVQARGWAWSCTARSRDTATWV